MSSMMTIVDGRNRVMNGMLTFFLRAFAFLVGVLPPRVFVPMGHLMGSACYAAGFRKAIAKKNLLLAFPQLSESERKCMLKRVYQNTCTSLLWFLHLRANERWKQMDRYVDIEFPPEYLEDIAKGPIIVTSAHIGCWELLPFIHSNPYLPVQSIYELYRPLHNAPLNEFVLTLRSHQSAITLLPDKNCMPTLYSILKESKSNTIVALLCDQRPSRNHVPVNFLHLPTLYAPGAAVLYSRTSRPLWFTALLHQPSSAYKPFRLITVPIIRNEFQSLQLDTILQKYADQVSKLVQAHPDQYIWFHDLWKAAT